MARIVAKFGGTSVADIERIENVADKVAREVEAGHEMAVVVSAMSGVTNKLVQYCAEVSPLYDAREYDTVVSSGEQVTAGLLAIALQKRGISARSWMGWQIPMKTSDIHGKARIEDINTKEMEKRFAEQEVAVIAGFQGVTRRKRIATLGRGGSDTTAVALAAALKANRCDIYTDVDGVYTTDPRIVKKARKIKKISYDEMLELASLGAKVLQTRSVEMAYKRDVSLQVLSSFEERVGSELPGTLVTKEEDIMEKHVVNGIAFTKDEAKITVFNVPDIPGVAAEVFRPLAKNNINVDMIVQNTSSDGKVVDITFIISEKDADTAVELLEKNKKLKGAKIRTAKDIVKISAVGIGMTSHPGVAQTMFKTLAEKGINMQVIATSEIKISVIIDKEYLELAVRALHDAYGLDKKKKK
ncbi:MAG: aspartate kinase [Alphaproteobacteria bacterium]|nr:aspartate kinase [Alphaproteobacteria bacterium]